MTRLFASAALLPSGWAQDVAITLDAGRIASVELGARQEGADERHAALLPAMANLHSHAFQRAMSGLTERRGKGSDSFWSWRTLMYKFALSMTPDDVEAVAAQLYVEMLEAGFCRVGEFHYLHHDQDGAPYADLAEMGARIAAASVEAGIGLTLLPVFYAHAGFGAQAPADGQRRFINDLDRFANLMDASRRMLQNVPDAILGLAPHSLRAATVEEIGAILPLAPDGPVHIHIAEQVQEVEDCLAATGKRPVDLLFDHVDVDLRWCLIHATHLTPSETDRMAASGAIAGLCPITEANLGDGIFAGEAFRAAGGSFGVGSDSNVQITLAGELRQYEYSQRLALRRRNVLVAPGGSVGEAIYQAAASGGAAALGTNSGLEAGRPADLLSLNSRAGHLAPQALLDGFVFGMDVDVADVWVGGRKLVSDGRHIRRDAVRQRFDRVMRRLVEA